MYGDKMEEAYKRLDELIDACDEIISILNHRVDKNQGVNKKYEEVNGWFYKYLGIDRMQ